MNITIKIDKSILTAKSDVDTMKCPKSTQDVVLNTRNRNLTRKNHSYGPLNIEEPGGYWKEMAKKWRDEVLLNHTIYARSNMVLDKIRSLK